MKSILIVDDEPALLTIFELECEDQGGLEVHTASSGSEAMEIIQSREIDFMLTDLTMPTMDGIKLLNLLKDLNIEIPHKIVISGLPKEMNQEQLDLLGVSKYFEKPFSIKELVNYLKSK